MPVLKNSRHEAFAQQLVQAQRYGWTRGAAYSRAGYKAEGHAAEANAHRLLKNAESGVVSRVQELSAGGARRAEITAASVLEKLDRVYDGATDAKQFSAAGRAAEAQARIAGVGAADRIEVGAPGSISEATVAETLQMVAREFTPATASALAWLLDHDDVEMPVDEVARFTLANMPLGEALQRNDRLRDELLLAASEGAVLVQAIPQDQPPRDQIDHAALRLLQQPRQGKARQGQARR